MKEKYCTQLKEIVETKVEIKYNKNILFIKEIFLKGVNNLSSYELIWRLIVLLLLSNNDLEDSQKTQD